MATDLEMMCSVVTGYYFLGIEIDDKLVGTTIPLKKVLSPPQQPNKPKITTTTQRTKIQTTIR